MAEQEKAKKIDIVFDIRRFSPEELLSFSTDRFWRSRKMPNRSYNITSDSQRMLFIQKVITKELTIREVLLEKHLTNE